jgi:hypothetical protein
MPEFRQKHYNTRTLFEGRAGKYQQIHHQTATEKALRAQGVVNPPQTTRNSAQQLCRCFSETGQHIVDLTVVQLQNLLFAEIRRAGKLLTSHKLSVTPPFEPC